jgi:hypothetical protein
MGTTSKGKQKRKLNTENDGKRHTMVIVLTDKQRYNFKKKIKIV